MEVYKVKVITPLIAPYKIDPTRVVPEGKYREDGEDVRAHIDNCFFRIHGKPAVMGNTVWGAIKRSLGIRGRPTNSNGKQVTPPQVYYLLFREEDVVLYTYNIVSPAKKQTLAIAEMVVPGAEGELYAEGLKAFLASQNYKNSVLPLVIGPKRRMGYGQLIVFIEEEKK